MCQAKGMLSAIGIVFCVITVVAGKCSDNAEVCDYIQWSQWSTCTRTCGGSGLQSRNRVLCCKQEWIDDGSCRDQCNKYDYYDSRSCGEVCLNNGRIKTSGYGCDCLDRSFGFCCGQLLPGCTPFPTDVIFILDSSASQTRDQFQIQLDFVRKFVEQINISWEEFQIAVITFSTDARVDINFNPYINKDALLNMIKEIDYRPGATFTDKGLKEAMEVARRSERREGMVTLTYAFVLTDGMSNKRSETRLAAKNLKSSGIKVIAIGIGKEVSHQELVDIASPGDTFSPSYVFSVGDFNALATILKRLVHVTCKDCSTVKHLSDIVFLVDESNEMSEMEFQISVDAMTSIVKSCNHIGEPDGPVFGLVRLGNTIETVIEPSGYQVQNNLQVKFQKLNRRQSEVCDKNQQCSGSNITSAVDHILLNFYSTKKRQNTRKFLVVLSNGKFENQNSVKEEIAEISKTSDVKLFVIGPGLDVNMDGLLSLANEANHDYVILDSNDLSKLDVMQSEFSYNSCKKT
ncbi:collagen alpha-6(VI) chain-like [Mercenaria mercenaria]|uniref:collagen alpha-6(VI) chain-like n=1 Tax=Mercenaria mercenaria TaxID=6596 RepID=UPI00234E4059|nr:collagen alpha-6(VI) chain-like [Mercenaria mercenaria]XP_053382203.1 collagen alpha-6(VI) chain-like [Mercenaria mercenaria]